MLVVVAAAAIITVLVIVLAQKGCDLHNNFIFYKYDSN